MTWLIFSFLKFICLGILLTILHSMSVSFPAGIFYPIYNTTASVSEHCIFPRVLLPSIFTLFPHSISPYSSIPFCLFNNLFCLCLIFVLFIFIFSFDILVLLHNYLKFVGIIISAARINSNRSIHECEY